MGRHRGDSCSDSGLSEFGVSRKARLNKLWPQTYLVFGRVWFKGAITVRSLRLD